MSNYVMLLVLTENLLLHSNGTREVTPLLGNSSNGTDFKEAPVISVVAATSVQSKTLLSVISAGEENSGMTIGIITSVAAVSIMLGLGYLWKRRRAQNESGDVAGSSAEGQQEFIDSTHVSSPHADELHLTVGGNVPSLEDHSAQSITDVPSLPADVDKPPIIITQAQPSQNFRRFKLLSKSKTSKALAEIGRASCRERV